MAALVTGATSNIGRATAIVAGAGRRRDPRPSRGTGHLRAIYADFPAAISDSLIASRKVQE